MKTIRFKCLQGSGKINVDFFYGEPSDRLCPIFYQNYYLRYFKGIIVSNDIIEKFDILSRLSKIENKNFEYLCSLSFNSTIDKKNDDLNFLFLNGDLTKKPTFFEVYKKIYIKNQECPSACFILGAMEEEENGSVDYAEIYYQKSLADARSLYCLALNVETKKKVDLLLESAILGEEKSIHELAIGLDVSEEFRLYLLSLKKTYEFNNNGRSLMILGVILLLIEPNESILCFEKANILNHPVSNYYLGLIYERGLGGVKPDLKKSINYYEQEVLINFHYYSIHRLALIYDNGESCYPLNNVDSYIEPCKEKAIEYYKKLIDIDDTVALYNLSCLYWSGHYTRFDPVSSKLYAEKALFCYNKKSQLNELSCDELADIYMLLGDYYYYFENKNEKSIEFYQRGINTERKIDYFVRCICFYYRNVAKKLENSLKRREYYDKCIRLIEYTIRRRGILDEIDEIEEFGFFHYFLGKLYAKYLYDENQKENLEKSKNHLTKAIKIYRKRIRIDNDNTDAAALYRIGQIIDLNIIPNEENEKSVDYYERAARCTSNWFHTRIYKAKAEKRILKYYEESVINEEKNLFKNKEISFKNDIQNDQHIMISYASESRSIANLLHENLKKYFKNYKVWIDYNDMNDRIFHDMAFAVENASHIIACISEYYEKSPYCEKELTHAFSCYLKHKKPIIIPVIVQDNYLPKNWLAIPIAGIKYYRVYDEESLENFFKKNISKIINLHHDEK